MYKHKRRKKNCNGIFVKKNCLLPYTRSFPKDQNLCELKKSIWLPPALELTCHYFLPNLRKKDVWNWMRRRFQCCHVIVGKSKSKTFFLSNKLGHQTLSRLTSKIQLGDTFYYIKNHNFAQLSFFFKSYVKLASWKKNHLASKLVTLVVSRYLLPPFLWWQTGKRRQQYSKREREGEPLSTLFFFPGEGKGWRCNHHALTLLSLSLITSPLFSLSLSPSHIRTYKHTHTISSSSSLVLNGHRQRKNY